MTDWYQQETDDVLRQLATSFESALSSAEAHRRLEEYGPNELQAAAGQRRAAGAPLWVLIDTHPPGIHSLPEA